MAIVGECAFDLIEYKVNDCAVLLLPITKILAFFLLHHVQARASLAVVINRVLEWSYRLSHSRNGLMVNLRLVHLGENPR